MNLLDKLNIRFLKPGRRYVIMRTIIVRSYMYNDDISSLVRLEIPWFFSRLDLRRPVGGVSGLEKLVRLASWVAPALGIDEAVPRVGGDGAFGA